MRERKGLCLTSVRHEYLPRRGFRKAINLKGVTYHLFLGRIFHSASKDRDRSSIVRFVFCSVTLVSILGLTQAASFMILRIVKFPPGAWDGLTFEELLNEIIHVVKSSAVDIEDLL